jgi:hypothetical protein
MINCTKKQDSTLTFQPKSLRPTVKPYTAGLSVSDLQIQRIDRGIKISPGKKLKVSFTVNGVIYI